MNSTVKTYIGVGTILALIILGVTIWFIASRKPFDSMSGMSIATVLYLYIFFGIITYLYLTNTWIFENYEHPVVDDTNTFARPYGVHTIPITNNCTVNSDGTVVDENGYVYDPAKYISSDAFLSALSTGVVGSDGKTIGQPCNSKCSNGFNTTKDINSHPCLNTKGEVVCFNGNLQSSYSPAVCPPK